MLSAGDVLVMQLHALQLTIQRVDAAGKMRNPGKIDGREAFPPRRTPCPEVAYISVRRVSKWLKCHLHKDRV